MAKINKTEYDALPEALKGNFIADGDDYVLKTEDVAGLKSALKAEREQREAAEKLAKQFDGIDAAKAKQMIADAQKAEEEAKKKEGKFDEILKAKEAEWEAKYAAERDARNRLEADFAEKDVESILVKGLSSAKVISDRLDAAKKLMRDAVEYERKDGSTVVKFKDDTGYASEMKPEEFAAKWAQKYPYFFEADGKGGAGDRNESNAGFAGGAKTMKRSAFDAMSPQQKAEFAASGGSLTD